MKKVSILMPMYNSEKYITCLLYTSIILKRRVYFMGRWIKHGGKYPELLLRIFRTGFGECEQKLMDEHMILKSGNKIKFDCDIIDNRCV